MHKPPPGGPCSIIPSTARTHTLSCIGSQIAPYHQRHSKGIYAYMQILSGIPFQHNRHYHATEGNHILYSTGLPCSVLYQGRTDLCETGESKVPLQSVILRTKWRSLRVMQYVCGSGHASKENEPTFVFCFLLLGRCPSMLEEVL